MQIKRIKVENILSIQTAEIHFDETGLVLIDGWNHDLNRANGAGKSAIFNAISFAIYNKLPRKITKSEIIRRGTKSGYAEVDVEIGADLYTIKRGRPIELQVFKNSVQVVMSQEELEALINLSYDQFITTMYTAQNSTQRFILLNDTDKKQFILDLMKLNDFTTIHKRAKDMVSATESLLGVKQLELDNLKSRVNIYKESLVNEDEINNLISCNQQVLKALNGTLVNLSAINRPNLDRYEEIEQKLYDSKSKLAVTRVNRVNFSNQFNDLKKLVETPFKFSGGQHQGKCPSCSEDLIIQDGEIFHKDFIENARKVALQNYEKDKQLNLDKMSALKLQIDKCDEELLKDGHIDSLLAKSNDRKRQETKAHDDAKLSILDTKNQIRQLENENNNLSDKLSNNKIVSNKIKDILTQATSVSASKKHLQGELELLKACLSVYSPTGAQAYIMDSIVDLFNNACQEYIAMIWPNASYKLQTYKTNSDKSVTAKFSDELLIDSKEVSIGSLSGGELRSLSLAIDFAIIDVVSTHFGIQMNPIILDEGFDGLDSVGRELVIDLLNKISQRKQIVIIEHSTEAKALFSKVIRVEKRNGISYLT